MSVPGTVFHPNSAYGVAHGKPCWNIANQMCGGDLFSFSCSVHPHELLIYGNIKMG